MTIDEDKVRDMERRTPELAQAAVRHAFEQSLRAGNTVMVRRGAAIVRVSPDGTERFVKPARPLTPVRRGAKVRLR